jgi:2-polyprenyl-3-methyl-5-hydroxy-6-metoxy-1,4-benzoquinol methylase
MNCKICNSARVYKYETIDNYTLLKCNDCKVIFLENIDKILSTLNLYNENYFKNYLYENEIDFQSIKLTAKYYLNYIQNNFGEIRSILDVGAGFGLFVKAFNELGLNADGVEISKYSVQIAKEKFGIELFNGSLIDFQTDKKYDLICFYHSFEHLPNPVQTLLRVKELLNKDGVLWLSLPNVMSLDRFIHKEKWNGWSLPYHFFHYSPKSIKNLLRRQGFRKIKIQKSFLNPIKLIDRTTLKKLSYQNLEYSKIKELMRKPATLIFSGQNMNVFGFQIQKHGAN